MQTLVVAVIGLFFAWRAFARFAPKAAWRLHARLAYALEAPGRPAALRRVGVWLRPSVPTATACGSGASSACSACGSCAPGDAVAPEPSPRAIPAQLR